MLAVLIAPAGVGAGVWSMPMVMPPATAWKAPERAILHAGGLSITWPLAVARTTLAPGTPITVDVRRLIFAQHRRVARIALVRLGRPNRVLDVVQQAQLEDGSFTVRVPGGRRYVLRIAVGHWRHQSAIRVSTGCLIRNRRPRATLRIDPTVAHAGDTVVSTLANTGSVCVPTGLSYRWQRQLPSGWEPVPPPPNFGFPLIGLTVGPGGTLTDEVPVWDTMKPGRYRLTKDFNAGGTTVLGGPAYQTVASNTLDVVAP
jgi:hypothetical protein